MSKNLQDLWNGARQAHGYYDGLIGSRIRAFDWYQNQWPWMTLISRSVTLTEKIIVWRQLHTDILSEGRAADVDRVFCFISVSFQTKRTRRSVRQGEDGAWTNVCPTERSTRCFWNVPLTWPFTSVGLYRHAYFALTVTAESSQKFIKLLAYSQCIVHYYIWVNHG